MEKRRDGIEIAVAVGSQRDGSTLKDSFLVSARYPRTPRKNDFTQDYLPLHLGYVFANNDLINVNVNTRLSASVLLMVGPLTVLVYCSSLTWLTTGTGTGNTGYL